MFEELKQVKTQIEHLQHLLEQDRLKIVKEFEDWWAKQELDIEVSFHCQPLVVKFP